MISIVGCDQILLVKANAIAVLPVHSLWNGHVKERVVVVRDDRFELAKVLPVVT